MQLAAQLSTGKRDGIDARTRQCTTKPVLREKQRRSGLHVAHAPAATANAATRSPKALCMHAQRSLSAAAAIHRLGRLTPHLAAADSAVMVGGAGAPLAQATGSQPYILPHLRSREAVANIAVNIAGWLHCS